MRAHRVRRHKTVEMRTTRTSRRYGGLLEGTQIISRRGSRRQRMGVVYVFMWFVWVGNNEAFNPTSVLMLVHGSRITRAY